MNKQTVYQYLLLDLDGTITDPGVGITGAVEYALCKFGITIEERSTLYPFIGPPLIDSFMKYYGFTEEEARQAVIYYREYYTDKGIFENQVYEGMEQLLKVWKGRGLTLILATSKPELFAKQILKHFELDRYFTVVAGATMDETRIRKQDVIAYALEQLPSIEKRQAVMIGDREHDILGAKCNDLDSIGVLFGYGSQEELESAGAGKIARTVKELQEIING